LRSEQLRPGQRSRLGVQWHKHALRRQRGAGSDSGRPPRGRGPLAPRPHLSRVWKGSDRNSENRSTPNRCTPVNSGLRGMRAGGGRGSDAGWAGARADKRAWSALGGRAQNACGAAPMRCTTPPIACAREGGAPLCPVDKAGPRLGARQLVPQRGEGAVGGKGVGGGHPQQAVRAAAWPAAAHRADLVHKALHPDSAVTSGRSGGRAGRGPRARCAAPRCPGRVPCGAGRRPPSH
jgi:hypothetical protein